MFSSDLFAQGSPVPAEIQIQMILLKTPNMEHGVERRNPAYTKRAAGITEGGTLEEKKRKKQHHLQPTLLQ